MDREQFHNKCSSIEEKILDNPLFLNSTAVMTYIDFRGEVRTTRIIEHCLSNNIRVIIPVCMPKTRTLLLSELKNIHDDLAESHFGLLEPKQDKIRPVDAREISLILVPGAVFDPRGYRIGYGAGYYDRFLSGPAKGIPTFGLAFECQMIEKVPRDEYDMPVDYIFTEDRIIDCKLAP